MNNLKQGAIAVLIATAFTGLQFALASAPTHRVTQEVPAIEKQSPVQTLSWIEAQQRRHNIASNGELNAEQQNKLVTMIRLMTLEL